MASYTVPCDSITVGQKATSRMRASVAEEDIKTLLLLVGAMIGAGG